MNTDIKLKLELTGKGNSYFLYNGTEKYFEKLRSAYLDIKNDKVNDYLYFSFVTLCASTLEYSLNFILACYCVDSFSIESYRNYLEQFISIKFRNKILLLPHIISDGKFILNEDSQTFKQLSELVAVRNKILHNKEFLKAFDSGIKLDVVDGEIFVPVGMEEISFSFETEPNIIDKIDKKMCLDFADALGDFKAFVMAPYLDNSLSENHLITLKK